VPVWAQDSQPTYAGDRRVGIAFEAAAVASRRDDTAREAFSLRSMPTRDDEAR
jgi:hypothetical protein